MPVNVTFSAAALYAFLLVLARMAGALAFLPLPGFKGAPEQARAALAVGLTLALHSRWPAMDGFAPGPGALAAGVLAETAIGLTIGVSMAMALEAFSLAAQILGLQAGYAYASTIDPTTEADSGVLLVMAQLVAGLMFFSLGLDREALRLVARSLERIPPGAWPLARASAGPIIALCGSLFAVGLRLAFPVVALLTMLDLALALLGRLNQSLQLLSLSFPVKMLTALLALSWIAAVMPRILLEYGGLAWGAARRALGL